MSDPPRPDPDALLRHLAAESARARRGRLKIFFGFAPGVGKTYRMLQVARALAAQGVDVLVGVVETHGRRETAALAADLPVLPRRAMPHRGRMLEELDLEAALARAPALILVDELAHSNPEGARHGKRWRDVLDLIEAGIDVLTTINVQHVESLHDVIAQITGVQVRETVPDLMLELADEIELIDLGPDELLARLKEGKVYLPEQAERAAAHFFQRGNLLALRELALRRTAEHVDANVQDYRAAHAVARTWPTSERVLVSVSAAPSTAKLIRAAKRIAAGLRAPWTAAHVEAASRAPLRAADAARLERHLALAESLGATVVHLSGIDVAGPLLAYARRHNVTRLIVGKPTHARLRDRLRGSLLDDVVRASGDIDVHVIAGDAEPPGEPGSSRPEASRSAASTRAVPYSFAALAVALTTLLALGVRAVYAVPDLEMLYLLPIIVTASRFGRGPSLLAALLSIAAYDFFFVPPTLAFAVNDARFVLTFAMLFAVGSVLSTLTVRLRRQERWAREREQRAHALNVLGRSLGALLDKVDAAKVVARCAADGFGAEAAVLAPGPDGALALLSSAPEPLSLGPTEQGAAAWVLAHAQLAGLGTDTLPASRAVCAPLSVGPSVLGVLALFPRAGRPLTAEGRSFLEAFCRQAAFALERARLAEQARVAALRAKTEELRSSLLSTVSHDLRTPLAVITGAATTLRARGDALSGDTRADLLDTVSEEAARLERLVANLLDMTRLETGGLSPELSWVPLDELVGAALTRLEPKLVGRSVHCELGPEPPLVAVDPVLLQQVLVNLLENAAKYTPAGSPIEIAARFADATMAITEISVADRGPGVASADLERVFEKFQRGQHPGIAGAGLGLAICRGIVEAHGGTLTLAHRQGGGLVARIVLPTPVRPADA